MNLEELTKKLEKNREDFLRKERDLNISISMSLTYDEAILRLDELKTAYEEEKKKIEREIFKIKSKKSAITTLNRHYVAKTPKKLI